MALTTFTLANEKGIVMYPRSVIFQQLRPFVILSTLDACACHREQDIIKHK